MIKKAGFLDQTKLNKIVELLRSGGKGKIKFNPVSNLPPIDKIIIENTAPSDSPNALAYVVNDPKNKDKSDDIHLVLPAIEKAIQDEMRKQGLDPSELSSLDLSNLENNPKINTIIILLSSALHIFSHELGHLSGFKDSGEFKPEPFAESEAERAMQSFKVSNKIDAGLELKKLASKLDDLGEASFVKDVYLIASMLPKEEVTPEIPKKIAKRDLDLLQKDLEKLFSK
jgi:hypothetical protein